MDSCIQSHIQIIHFAADKSKLVLPCIVKNAIFLMPPENFLNLFIYEASFIGVTVNHVDLNFPW